MIKALVACVLATPWVVGISALLTSEEIKTIAPASLPTTTNTIPLPTTTSASSLELCQYAYLHHYITAAKYLTCTRGLHADEARTTHYAWMPGGVARTEPELESQMPALVTRLRG